ncbi:hypothetical protein [Chitinophaga ginsengisegetis]|uniref:hypothetical protein n=1 Tax=Chitinophaga ginsengisegetis TaxID=393003 RepID=UPI000DB95A4D|nr:hypothetical protein [Chitinophaga ginsengisegetis]MDR6565486.1 hypothetical protein [Chitinophaga ginsengisegetis]MDR6645214.1 hypothetical protein [Chitinophaga ginsengisegetis]MDR6652194.1 hypothetical protein [Chitinophaga ginsengisegetis]
MALDAKAVKTAHKLLLKIGGVNNYIREYHKDEEHPFNTVMGYYPHGGGWENVFMDVLNITDEQLQEFNEGKKAVPNTSFEDDLGKGVTRIGWF